MARPLDIRPLRWSEAVAGEPSFRDWFGENVEQGQHVNFIGPTGSGKTTFWTGILPLRQWVLAFDPKGGDSTLKRTGFQRITKWPPPPKAVRAIERGEPFRAIVGAPISRMEDYPKLRDLFRTVLRDVFAWGNWTVYVDELQVATDTRLLGLKAEAEMLLIAARDRGVSFWSSYQAPRFVPKTAGDQSTWFGVAHTRDTDVVNRLAEMAGRPKAEMRGFVAELDRYCVALFSNNPASPVIVTRPDPPSRRRPG